MMLKVIKVECSECGWFQEATEPDAGPIGWDELINMEDEDCPRCNQKVVDSI